jgi:hypothetical protein
MQLVFLACCISSLIGCGYTPGELVVVLLLVVSSGGGGATGGAGGDALLAARTPGRRAENPAICARSSVL